MDLEHDCVSVKVLFDEMNADFIDTFSIIYFRLIAKGKQLNK